MNYVDGKNLKKNCPGLTTVILSGNGVKGWNVIGDLGVGCPKLDFLSLVGNPVTSKSYHFMSNEYFLGIRVFLSWRGGRENDVFMCQNFNTVHPHDVPSLLSLPLI